MAYDEPDIRFERERTVEQNRHGIPEPPPLSPKTVGDPELEELIRNTDGVRNKAKRMLDAISSNPNKDFIEVSEDAAGIRAAVARLDPTQPDGARISFTLYREGVDKFTSVLSKDEMLEFVEGLTGIASIDSNKTRSKKSEGMGGMGALTFDSAAHALLLYMLGQLLAGWTGTEAAKQGGSTAAAGATSSWVVAIGMLAAQHYGLDSAAGLEKLLEQKDGIGGQLSKALSASGMTPDTFFRAVDEYQASSPAAEIPLMFKEADTEIVHEYANDVIAKDSDFIDWGMATELAGTVNELGSMGDQLTGWMGAAALGAEAAIKMPKDMYDTLTCNTNGTNLNLDMTATMLNSHYSADLVCCFVRYLGSNGFNTEGLKTLRTLLKFQSNGISIDLRKINKMLFNSFRKKLSQAILQPMAQQVRKFFSRVGRDITKWLDPKSHVDKTASPEEQQEQLDKWKQLFTCTPVDEMLRYLLKALKHLEQFTLKLMKKLWDSIQKKHGAWKLKLGALGDKKRLDAQIKVLDAVIKALEKGNLCASKDAVYPEDGQIRDIARRILGEIPDVLPLAPPEGLEADPYNRFNPVSYDTPSGVRISNLSSETDPFNIDKVSTKDCMKRLTDENVIPLSVGSPSMEVTRNVQRIREIVDEKFFKG